MKAGWKEEKGKERMRRESERWPKKENVLVEGKWSEWWKNGWKKQKGNRDGK